MSTSSPNPASPTHHALFREGELASLHHSNALKPQKGLRKLAEINADLVLKYCMVNRLTPASDVEAILLFFVRMLELLSYALP